MGIMAVIYGVDTDRPYGPVEAKGAIVRCFFEAHRENMQLGEGSDQALTQEYAQETVKKLMEETGGDFENPTKENLIKLCGKIREFSSNFKSPEELEKCYAEVAELVEGLK